MKIISIIIFGLIILFNIDDITNSGLWGVIVFLIVIMSALGKNKKKSKKRKTKKHSVNYKKSSSSVNRSNSKNYFSDIKINSNDYKSGYKNEPINQTEKFIGDNKKIERLRQMKSMTISKSYTDTTDKVFKLFYLQASFMDDFTDDYEISVPCNIYIPTYNALNMYQLRSYFSWRTLARIGDYQKTELSYVFLYTYELLNKIGVKNSIDGLNKLIELWEKYREFDDKIDAYFPLWIKDYYLVNDINIDYKLIEKEFPIINLDEDKLFEEIMIGNYENKLNYFDSISSYHILKSKIMEHKYSFLIEMIIPKVFTNLEKYFNEQGYSFTDILFGKIAKKDWKPFLNAIYYRNPLNPDFSKTINDIEKYYKVKDNYYKETFVSSEYSKNLMGYILKNFDVSLRECLKISRNLKVNDNILENVKNIDSKLYEFFVDGEIANIITITIKKYLIENKQNIQRFLTDKKKQEITIDTNKFADIRDSSSRVQEKLIIEEEAPIVEKIEEEVQVSTSSDNIFVNLINSINNIEIEFIKKIFDGSSRGDLIDYCKQNNILYEIMIENINNKALETIGDNIIEDYGDEIIIYAEYVDSIKESIG